MTERTPIENSAQEVDFGLITKQIPLTELAFDFTPTGLVDLQVQPDQELQLVYAECYKIIFGKKCVPDNINRTPGSRAKIERACEELRLSQRLFFLTNMYAHQLGNPERKFYASMLLGQHAYRRVERYRDAVSAEYGALDDHSLDLFAGQDLSAQTYQSRLLESEILAGSWLLGYRLRQDGNPLSAFYLSCEQQLSTVWLCLEPSYYQHILVPWCQSRDGTEQQQRWRSAICANLAKLKKKKIQSKALFDLRAQLFPQAIQAVLRPYGLRADDFCVQQPGWTDPILFWNRLGLAVQHYLLLSYYESRDEQFLRQLRQGSLK